MKILVVVDMQVDFVDGALGTVEAQAIVPNVCHEIEERASEDTIIIFTKDTHKENYMETLEGKNLPVPHCIEYTDGWNINSRVWNAFSRVEDKYNDLKTLCPYLNKHVITKPTFGSENLQHVLREIEINLGWKNDTITEITLIGLCTGICVLSNAIMCKATLPEVDVNVIEDCCACVTPESHKIALEAMKLCQINVM